MRYLDFSVFLLCITDNDSSTCIHKNADVRLKRLHNRILKDAVYERNFTSNNDKPKSQQNNELLIENTKHKLIEQAQKQVLGDEMDWEPIHDEEIAFEVFTEIYY